MDEITARYSMLQSLSASDLDDSLEPNIHCTQAMWEQIAHEMSKLQKEPAQQDEIEDQAANLWAQEQQLAEIMEEEMTHCEQVSVLSHMHLQQVEEVKVQSQEIHCLLALVEEQQEAIKTFSSCQSPPTTPWGSTSCSDSQLDVMWEEILTWSWGW